MDKNSLKEIRMKKVNKFKLITKNSNNFRLCYKKKGNLILLQRIKGKWLLKDETGPWFASL